MNEYLEHQRGHDMVTALKQFGCENWLKRVTSSELNQFLSWYMQTCSPIESVWLGQAFRGFVTGLECAKKRHI